MEEVLHYLQHIYDIWGRITLYNPVIQRAINLSTVQHLKLRVPVTSHTDAVIVRDLIQSGQLFRDIRDPVVRSRLQRAILRIPVLIPSIRIFHENMKLLIIDMMILRDHVIDELGARLIRAAIADCWEPSENCVLEHRENVFRELDLAPTMDLAYR